MIYEELILYCLNHWCIVLAVLIGNILLFLSKCTLQIPTLLDTLGLCYKRPLTIYSMVDGSFDELKLSSTRKKKLSHLCLFFRVTYQGEWIFFQIGSLSVKKTSKPWECVWKKNLSSNVFKKIQPTRHKNLSRSIDHRRHSGWPKLG